MVGALSFAVSRKRGIIKIFWVLYGIIILFLTSGVWAGRLALTSFIITTIPGIARRFGIKQTIPALILVFRRQFGILMYILALKHFLIVRGIPPRPLFETIGFTAFLFTLPLFLTSNDVSQRKLGKWWHRVHSLSYIIVWFLFLHTFLQRVSVWSIAIGLTAILSLVSHIYHWYKRRLTSVALR